MGLKEKLAERMAELDRKREITAEAMKLLDELGEDPALPPQEAPPPTAIGIMREQAADFRPTEAARTTYPEARDAKAGELAHCAFRGCRVVFRKRKDAHCFHTHDCANRAERKVLDPLAPIIEKRYTKNYPHTCRSCGKAFVAKVSKGVRYCSQGCGDAGRAKDKAAREAGDMLAVLSEPAGNGAAARPVPAPGLTPPREKGTVLVPGAKR
jgi:hypothetical protein